MALHLGDGQPVFVDHVVSLSGGQIGGFGKIGGI